MARNVLIVALSLLAVFLPLVCVPLATFILEPRVFSVYTVEYAGAPVTAVALLSLVLFRGPPSH